MDCIVEDIKLTKYKCRNFKNKTIIINCWYCWNSYYDICLEYTPGGKISDKHQVFLDTH